MVRNPILAGSMCSIVTRSVAAMDEKGQTRSMHQAIAERLAFAHPAFHGSEARTAYAVCDELLPDRTAKAIAAAFPVDGAGFSELDTFRERKLTTNAFDSQPMILAEAAFALQHPTVIAEVERITGMRELQADPTCYAGGLSLMRPGDFLNPHVDNSHNGARSLYRRVNLLLYCSPEWRAGDGGELELWDRDVSTAARIAPAFNRLAIIATNRTSWHSVAPVTRGLRRCISAYYFSEASPDGTAYYHITSFTGRPGQPVRRVLGVADNALRQFARRLGARRSADRGFQGVTARRES